MLTVYIGATFNLSGVLQRDGLPSDFTGWGVTANLSDQAGVNVIAPLVVTMIDPSNGLLSIGVADTSSWPACKARIDMKLTTPAGDIILGPPTYVRIAQSPLS